MLITHMSRGKGQRGAGDVNMSRAVVRLEFCGISDRRVFRNFVGVC